MWKSSALVESFFIYDFRFHVVNSFLGIINMTTAYEYQK